MLHIEIFSRAVLLHFILALSHGVFKNELCIWVKLIN